MSNTSDDTRTSGANIGLHDGCNYAAAKVNETDFFCNKCGIGWRDRPARVKQLEPLVQRAIEQWVAISNGKGPVSLPHYIASVIAESECEPVATGYPAGNGSDEGVDQ